MTREQVKKLTQVHQTLGLIYSSHGPKMTSGEEVLFARAIEQLFDVIGESSPNEPAAGSEWPATLEEQWNVLK